MIDFKIPDETKAIRDKGRDFVQSECHPAEESCTAENFDEVLAGLRKTARSQGLWCPFVPEEHGGMGLRPLANALVQMELGEIIDSATESKKVKFEFDIPIEATSEEVTLNFSLFLIMYSSSIHSNIGPGVTTECCPKSEKMGVTFGL